MNSEKTTPRRNKVSCPKCGSAVYSLYSRKGKNWNTIFNHYWCESCEEVFKLKMKPIDLTKALIVPRFNELPIEDQEELQDMVAGVTSNFEVR